MSILRVAKPASLGTAGFFVAQSHSEATMTKITKPPKALVREWMERRTHQNESPPPTPEDIRRELGWNLLPNNGPVPEVPD